MPDRHDDYFAEVLGACTHCAEPFTRDPRGDYMVTDALWRRLHPEGRKGFLHDACLLARAKEQGLVLTESSFTSCLCYVNRHIHLPTPVQQLDYLVTYFAEDTSDAAAQPRPHFGYVVAHALRSAADGDLWMGRPQAPSSVFKHLFTSEPARLGVLRLP